MDCIFCKIADKSLPAEIVFENEQIIAFKDIHPVAPVHVLVIPKKHIASVNDFEAENVSLAGEMVLAAKQIASGLQISEKGYKLLFRVGDWGGQEIPHVHLHLIGGAELYEEIRPM